MVILTGAPSSVEQTLRSEVELVKHLWKLIHLNMVTQTVQRTSPVYMVIMPTVNAYLCVFTTMGVCSTCR